MATDPAAIFKKIRRIQYQTEKLTSDVLAGAYRSAFKGKGMEFEEVREFQPGDDVRTVDWNVTARMNRPYVKNFREEREITLTLIVDISLSTRFGSGKETKSDLIAEVAAMLAFAAIKSNDKVALILFSEEVETYYPPKKGSQHVLRIIRELLSTTPKGHSTNIGNALSFLGRLHTQRGICFLLSDFISHDFLHQAKVIAPQQDLVCLCLTDPAEANFPAMGLVELADLENGQTLLVDTNANEVRQKLHDQVEERHAYYSKALRKIGSDFCVLRTDLPYDTQLKKFFLARQGRRR